MSKKSSIIIFTILIFSSCINGSCCNETKICGDACCDDNSSCVLGECLLNTDPKTLFVLDMISKGFSNETQNYIMSLVHGLLVPDGYGAVLHPGDLDIFAPESPVYMLENTTLLSEFDYEEWGNTKPGLWRDTRGGTIYAMYYYKKDTDQYPTIGSISIGKTVTY